MDSYIEQKFEEVRDLLIEAKYLVEEIGERGGYISSVKQEYLDVTTELIVLLSKINQRKLEDFPVEAMYKLLYKDYKQAKKEINKLRKDVEDLMKKKEIDTDKQVLVLKLMRAEREIKKLEDKMEIQKEKFKRVTDKYNSLKRELNKNQSDIELQD